MSYLRAAENADGFNLFSEVERRQTKDRLERERYTAPPSLRGRIADALENVDGRQPTVLGSGLAPEGRKLPDGFIPSGSGEIKG